MTATATRSRTPTTTSALLETTRVLTVAGITYGVVMAGIGSRVAMLVLRMTSPRQVVGMRSDDDFVIGRFTLAGTYNLLVLGAVVGIIGVGAYLLVAPRLVGPSWFGHLTIGLACAAVVGSMLIHADGVDFTELKPTWLAVGLFVLLPGSFGTFIGPVVESVRRTDSWTVRGRRRWLLPFVAMACVPAAIPVVMGAGLVAGVLTLVATNGALRQARSTPGFTMAVRTSWLAIAGAGLVALINDIGRLS